jgi:hypothetical protein
MSITTEIRADIGIVDPAALKARIAELEEEVSDLEGQLDAADEPDITPDQAFAILAKDGGLDELIELVALLSRESRHGKPAFELLRRLSGDAIPTLDGQLRLIDARKGG